MHRRNMLRKGTIHFNLAYCRQIEFFLIKQEYYELRLRKLIDFFRSIYEEKILVNIHRAMEFFIGAS